MSRTIIVVPPDAGGRRPRRSARVASLVQLLEPAGPVTLAAVSQTDPPADPPPGGSADGPADGAAGQPGAVKRPRTGLFTANSLDFDSPSSDATAAPLDTTEQTPAATSASGGPNANDEYGTSPPGSTDPGTSGSTATTSAAGATGSAQQEKPECGICLDTCLHPVKLPCGHVFCYLCVKGAAKLSARCAYCRAEVTEKFINNPRLLDETEVERELTDTSQSHHWLYQGRHGWWRYDERTSRDIETAFSAQQPSVQISVAGELYTVDFGTFTQFHDQCRGRRRRVRREAADAPPDPALNCKGVAGLRKKRRRQ
ncbi:E3 ubiquitin-protein ligase rnf146-like [Amphibalanus amphitrite]|uniref:E3 ubiquitin-protein ligase rnf146-like n=1 Tax=Amphibalanus amphitrite TaxID=1232801 RepID=UPI001C8FAA2C|nr:E3 ubiquitin-protein ligase rnf146-like [Amphibalanus amphitrite]XP_043219398.1 E3 ubiquitin-protein ligase rnf146-like [Amphibalanus amphitrite]XP_043219399.1 E3 ubiquitin-protein ligase rnf146-like [Amphibalanus amphitrite]